MPIVSKLQIRRDKFSSLWSEYVQILNTLITSTHGMGVFRKIRQMPEEGIPNLWAVVVEEKGQIQGFMSYKTSGIFKGVKVRDFLYKSHEAKYSLLDFIHRHTDQFTEFKIPITHQEHPEFWNYNLNPKIETRDWVPSAQGRIIIVERLDGMEVGASEFKLKVKDEYCNWNNKAYSFSSDKKLIVNEINNTKHEISIQALSALVYGTYHSGNSLKMRWKLKIPNNIIKRMEKMFPPALPWLYSSF